MAWKAVGWTQTATGNLTLAAFSPGLTGVQFTLSSPYSIDCCRRVERENAMLTPHLERLFDQLKKAPRKNSFQRGLLNELEIFEGNKAFETFVRNLGRLPPVEKPSEDHCKCCGASL